MAEFRGIAEGMAGKRGLEGVLRFEKRGFLLLGPAGQAAEPEAGEDQRGCGTAGEPHEQGNREPEPGGDGGTGGEKAADIVVNGIGAGALEAFFQKVFGEAFVVF